MRAHLARLLVMEPDLLLLDEPTNHLDLLSLLWLQNYLKTYSGAVLLISHDRQFMDEIVQTVHEIAEKKLVEYTGNYSDFESQRSARLAERAAAFVRQQREIAHVQDFVRRFRAAASKARQAQSRIKWLERLERIAPAHVDSPFHFSFLEPARLPRPLLSIDRGVAGYGSSAILTGLGISILPDIAVLATHRVLQRHDGFPPVANTELALLMADDASASTRSLSEVLAKFCSAVTGREAARAVG